MSRFLMDRGIFDNALWSDLPAFRLFFYLVGKASFKDEVEVGKVTLKRGQYIRSYRRLQSDLAYFENNAEKVYSTSVLKRCVEKLTKDGRITAEECEHGTLFTVVNYEQYQAFQADEKGELGTASEHCENSVRTIRTKAINANTKPPISPKGDRAKKAFRLPKEWEPDQKLLDWAQSEHPEVDPKWQTKLFKNNYLGNGKRMVDWDRTWQNWIARALDFSRPNPNITPKLVTKSKNQAMLEAWKQGKSFKHLPSGKTISADDLEPYSHLSSQVTEEKATAFRSKKTGNHAFLTEFEVISDG